MKKWPGIGIVVSIVGVIFNSGGLILLGLAISAIGLLLK